MSDTQHQVTSETAAPTWLNDLVRIGPDRVVPGGTNWSAMTLPQLYDAVCTNNDPSTVYSVADDWVQVGNNMLEAANSLHAQLAATHDGWQGTAADTARSAITQLIDWCGKASQTAQFMGVQLNQQGEIAATAKANMPDPAQFDLATAVQPQPGLSGLNASLTDTAALQAAADEAHAKAVDVATAMEQSTVQIDNATPEFEPVPPVSSGTRAAAAGTAAPCAPAGPGLASATAAPTVPASAGSTTQAPSVGAADPSAAGSTTTTSGYTAPPTNIGTPGSTTTSGYAPTTAGVSTSGYTAPSVTTPSVTVPSSTTTSGVPTFAMPTGGVNTPSETELPAGTSISSGGSTPAAQEYGGQSINYGPAEGEEPATSGGYSGGNYTGGRTPVSGTGSGYGGGSTYKPGSLGGINEEFGTGSGIKSGALNEGSFGTGSPESIASKLSGGGLGSASSAGGAGGAGGAGRTGGLGGTGRSAGASSGAIQEGSLAGEEAEPGMRAGAAAEPGAGTTGVPPRAGTGRKEEDKEHKARYLRGEKVFEPLGSDLPPATIGEKKPKQPKQPKK